MGILGDITGGFKNLGSDLSNTGHIISDNSGGIGDSLNQFASTVRTNAQHLNIENTTKKLADDVGKVGSKVSDGTAEGLEGVGVPDGIAEGVGIGTEVAADGALAA